MAWLHTFCGRPVRAERLDRGVQSLRRAAGRFRSVPVEPADRVLVGVVGEIFCRLHVFSNHGIVRRLEALGAEAWLSGIGEWVWYVNAWEVYELRRQGRARSRAMLGARGPGRGAANQNRGQKTGPRTNWCCALSMTLGGSSPQGPFVYFFRQPIPEPAPIPADPPVAQAFLPRGGRGSHPHPAGGPGRGPGEPPPARGRARHSGAAVGHLVRGGPGRTAQPERGSRPRPGVRPRPGRTGASGGGWSSRSPGWCTRGGSGPRAPPG